MKNPFYWLGIFLAMASDPSNNISSISQFGFYFATVAGQEHDHGGNLVVAGAPVRLGYIMCFHDQHTLFQIENKKCGQITCPCFLLRLFDYKHTQILIIFFLFFVFAGNFTLAMEIQAASITGDKAECHWTHCRSVGRFGVDARLAHTSLQIKVRPHNNKFLLNLFSI
jgi:hypothetical protein